MDIIEPVVVKTKAQRNKEATYKYRKNHPERYNLYQKSLYDKYKESDEWVLDRNEKCKIPNRRYYKKKMERKIEQKMKEKLLVPESDIV